MSPAGVQIITRCDKAIPKIAVWQPPTRDQIYSDCLNAPPLISTFNFNSFGRWLDGQDFSDGWPFAGYFGTMYNHVATPNWKGSGVGWKPRA